MVGLGGLLHHHAQYHAEEKMRGGAGSPLDSCLFPRQGRASNAHQLHALETALAHNPCHRLVGHMLHAALMSTTLATGSLATCRTAH